MNQDQHDRPAAAMPPPRGTGVMTLTVYHLTPAGERLPLRPLQVVQESKPLTPEPLAFPPCACPRCTVLRSGR